MLPKDFAERFATTGLYVRRVSARPPVQFQVLGERGTATNMVRKVIDKNVGIERTEGLGWKHAVPHMVAIPEDMLVICVVRNAVSWALSMHKRPWHAHPEVQALPFSEFIRAEWRGIVDRPADFEEIHPELVAHVDAAELQFDRHPITGKRFANLFDLRNVKQAAMLGMLNRDCNVLVVKAELVQLDQPRFAAWMIEQFGLPISGLRIKPVTARLGNRFNRSADARTPEEMSEADAAFMRSQLDLGMEAALGYDYAPE
ncbi:hypothetical protein U5922_005030 [Aquicoccus sp. G2-2]|uniref:hypothetical protein n=1 Tax=Aquicoccus sp. G2-2 TaxID=3092120 RepID=UPI002ADF4E1D|nr:hypothetical protein [Aquicoccus sp. G2-2]MEA1112863.1 hypothetical protein [Aquicoccus sp. G2-2]